MLTPKILIMAFILILITFGVIIWANTTEINLTHKMKQQHQISNFANCASAGYPVTQSNPRVCSVPNGPAFIESSNNFEPSPVEKQPICVNRCGDGVCQAVVCQGSGCICAESSSTCPQDCQ